MRLKRTQKSNRPWATRERERSKEAKTRRRTILFRLNEEPRLYSRRHNGPQRWPVGITDFSTISVILGECTASRLIADSQRGTAGCKEWTVDGPNSKRDEPARREVGFQLRVARCNLALLALYTCVVQNIILRVRLSVSALALTIRKVTPQEYHGNGRHAIISETNEWFFYVLLGFNECVRISSSL